MQYKITVNASQQQIDWIVDAALGGSGIGYWADRAFHVGGEGIQYTSEALTRGGHIRIHDNEADEPKWHYLTLKKLLKGIGLALEGGSLDLENYDGPMADAVVQYALFGEVIYG
jgi:hypothetical protein